MNPKSGSGDCVMNWRRLDEFRDPSVPKLHNLQRAKAAGLRVPPTIWIPAADALKMKDALANVLSPAHRGGKHLAPLAQQGKFLTLLDPAPWIIRSGSP